MTYFVLFVAMIIALASQFFESVQKDDDGRNRYDARGLPILTKPGLFIFAFIFLSFAASVLSTWFDKSESNRNQGELKTKLDHLEKPTAT